MKAVVQDRSGSADARGKVVLTAAGTGAGAVRP
jgi:hypothetical protein